MAAQAKPFASSSAVQPPFTADAEGAALASTPDQGGTRRAQIDQRLVELHALRGADELSFAQIAERLNDEFSMHMSRNAVIGRVHRMHLPRRLDFQRHGRPVNIPKKKPALAFVKKTKPKPVVAAGPRNLPLSQLKDRDCHFATTGTEPPFLYCGEPAVEGSSWCVTHFKLVHMRAP